MKVIFLLLLISGILLTVLSSEPISEQKQTILSRLSIFRTNVSLYTKKNFMWPFGLVSLIFGLGHFSGMTTLQTYAVAIFATLEAPIDKYYATIILGVAQVLGCILSSILVHFVGKRKINFFSLIGTGLCFLIVATYAKIINIMYLSTTAFRLQENNIVQIDSQTWIPLTFLAGASFFSHTGIRLLPWMLVGEVYHNDIRATASSFSGTMNYILAFISNKIFLSMISVLTLPGTFWFYSGVCLIGVILIFFLLPETEGKTLFQITEHFSGRDRLDNSQQ